MASHFVMGRLQYYSVVAVSGLIAYPALKRGIYPTYNRKLDASSKTVIVTGATGTLGAATTYDLARRQCRVLMACRNMTKCKELRRELVLLTGNRRIECKRLNLEDIESINNFADDVIKNEPKIDALINAAAVKSVPERELTKYGIEKHFWVNFLAPYLLTMRLLNKLLDSAKQTNDSRVVNIIGHPNKKWKLDPEDINFEKRRYSNKEAYQQSKIALAHFTIAFNRFFEKQNLRSFGIKLPTFGGIEPILYHREDNFFEYLYILTKAWINSSADAVCGSTTMCAVDDYMLKEDGGGGCYSYILRTWGKNKGWGHLANNEIDSKFVWNLGANILLGLPTTTEQMVMTNHDDISQSISPDDDTDSNTRSGKVKK